MVSSHERPHLNSDTVQGRLTSHAFFPLQVEVEGQRTACHVVRSCDIYLAAVFVHGSKTKLFTPKAEVLGDQTVRERERIISVRKLAEIFQCGKTQISTLLKNKKAVKDLYESNASSDVCQARKRNRVSEYADINDALFQWYQMCVKRNIYPDGSLLAEKAINIAERLGHTGFKASNGWLHHWNVRNNIKQRTVSGESGDVRSETDESWKERLPEILQGYKLEDIWNVDETGCFWRAFPDRM